MAQTSRPDEGSEPDADAIDELPDAETQPDLENVPAGGAGADSGAAEAVAVDGDDETTIPDVSPHNDIAGVGTRPADGFTHGDRGRD